MCLLLRSRQKVSPSLLTTSQNTALFFCLFKVSDSKSVVLSLFLFSFFYFRGQEDVWESVAQDKLLIPPFLNCGVDTLGGPHEDQWESVNLLPPLSPPTVECRANFITALLKQNKMFSWETCVCVSTCVFVILCSVMIWYCFMGLFCCVYVCVCGCG